MKNGHGWQDYLPQGEQQNLGIEPEACTSFGTLNAVEMMARKQYNDHSLWSKRYLAYISGTTHQGNSPFTVKETLKHQGTVTENLWPYTKSDNTWASFYEQPPASLHPMALEFPAHYLFDGTFIKADPQSLMQALQYSPVGVAGFAWAQRNGLYYSPNGTEPCHWFVIIDYVENQHWVIFDSYKPYIKQLAWDYVFSEPMQYSLNTNVQHMGAFQTFLTEMDNILVSVEKKVGLGEESYDRTLGHARSPHWRKVRDAHLRKQPLCQLCGGDKNLNVHHIIPFHIDPSRELDPTNLITLCNGSSSTISCHIRFGHFDNFRTKWNPNVVKDVALWRARFEAANEAALPTV